MIVDGFGGARPYVFDHQFFLSNERFVQFLCGFILDSQVIDYLHRFVVNTNGQFRATPRRRATAKLLRVIADYSSKGWDYNPFFYVMEATTKAAFGVALPWTRLYATSILRLQTMDDEVFLRSGEITPDARKIEDYVQRHGKVPFETAAHKVVTDIHRVASTENAGAMQLKATNTNPG